MIAADISPTIRRSPSLRKSVLSVISSNPDRHAVAHVIETSHRLALAYLIQKNRSGRLHTSLFGLDLDDLALDAIADLFRRQHDGQFIALQTYFRRVPEADMEGDPTSALRRLVFSKVNESLFRRYHEFDGNLSRIVRNLKDAAKASPRMSVLVRGRQPWLIVLDAQTTARNIEEYPTRDADLRRPIAPPEVLESYLVSKLHGVENVRDLTTHFIAFIELHTEYASGYPLVALAEIMRSAFSRVEDGDSFDTDRDAVFSHGEIEEAIRSVTDIVAAEKRAGYVGRGKVAEDVYRAYFSVIAASLSGQYLRDLDSESFYSSLAAYLPNLTEDQYMVEHRNILEYLTKLVRSRLVQFLSARAA